MAALLLLPFALALGTIALVVARARALDRPLADGLDTEAPLSEEELLRLRRWERRLRRTVLLVGFAYLAVLVAWLWGADAGPAQPASALILLGLACLLGAAIQFSERCPRCGFNLGFQARLLLPEHCERCRAPYR